MKVAQVTRWVVFGTSIAIALYDVYAIAVGGEDASVSQFVTDCSSNPKIAFVCGALCAHWFGWIGRPKERR